MENHCEIKPKLKYSSFIQVVFYVGTKNTAVTHGLLLLESRNFMHMWQSECVWLAWSR